MQKTYGHILTLIPDAKIESAINSFLLDIGFTVTHIDSLNDVKETIAKTGTDLVIGDLEKEADDGMHFLSEFSHTYPDLPIITLNSLKPRQVLNSLRQGAWDCLEKPIQDFSQLEQSVCKALERARLVNENKLYRYKLEQMNSKLETSLLELKQDQMAGKTVQEQMFPKQDLILGDYQFSHFILPSLYLSGDMVDYFAISERYAGFYIADVSGHGASSAFVTVMIKALYDQLLLSYKQNQNDIILYPQKVFSLANDYLIRASLGKYATIIYGVLDTQTHQLRLSVAGHYPGPVLADSESTKLINMSSFAVGMIQTAVYKEEIIEIPEGGKLGIFSDGLLEIIPGINLDDKEAIMLERIKDTSSILDLVKQFGLVDIVETPDDITILLIGRSYEKN